MENEMTYKQWKHENEDNGGREYDVTMWEEQNIHQAKNVRKYSNIWRNYWRKERKQWTNEDEIMENNEMKKYGRRRKEKWWK